MEWIRILVCIGLFGALWACEFGMATKPGLEAGGEGGTFESSTPTDASPPPEVAREQPAERSRPGTCSRCTSAWKGTKYRNPAGEWATVSFGASEDGKLLVGLSAIDAPKKSRRLYAWTRQNDGSHSLKAQFDAGAWASPRRIHGLFAINQKTQERGLYYFVSQHDADFFVAFGVQLGQTSQFSYTRCSAEGSPWSGSKIVDLVSPPAQSQLYALHENGRISRWILSFDPQTLAKPRCQPDPSVPPLLKHQPPATWMPKNVAFLARHRLFASFFHTGDKSTKVYEYDLQHRLEEKQPRQVPILGGTVLVGSPGHEMLWTGKQAHLMLGAHDQIVTCNLNWAFRSPVKAIDFSADGKLVLFASERGGLAMVHKTGGPSSISCAQFSHPVTLSPEGNTQLLDARVTGLCGIFSALYQGAKRPANWGCDP